MYAIVKGETVASLSYGPFTDASGTKHPVNALSLWSEEELAAVGVYRVVDSAIPEGMTSTGWSLVFDGSTVTRVFDLIPLVVEPETVSADLQRSRRQEAFQREADPLYFQWQAGEGTEAAWLQKREEIRVRYPYPVE
jgi:hypothetical protein